MEKEEEEELLRNNNIEVGRLHLVQDIQTRWNSTYYILEKLIEQQTILYLLATKFDAVTSLTPTQWYSLEKLLRLLQPFD